MENKTFEDKFGRKAKIKFFEKIACIEVLKRGYGKIENGYVVPKIGKTVEFNAIVFSVLEKNNALPEKKSEMVEV